MKRITRGQQTNLSCLLIIIWLIFSLPLQSQSATVVELFNIPGTSVWTVPSGVTSVQVEAWGGGGGGGGARGSQTSRGGGGAGGQYVRSTVAVSPGTDYDVQVGDGGQAGTNVDGSTGGDSFMGVNLVVAKGGAGGVRGNRNNGAGGAGNIVGGIGDIVYAGGHGAAGTTAGSGGGGGGAGSGGSGGNASGLIAGTGTAAGGGSGGVGLTSDGDGNSGSIAGGGGSGGLRTGGEARSGGSGAPGMLRLTYDLPPVVVLDKTASTSAAVIGDVITFTIAASNPFDEALAGIVIEDVLPVSMTYVTHISTLGSVNVGGQALSWTIPSLPAQSSATLTLAVTLLQQGTHTNTATAVNATPASASVLVLASAVTHFRMDEPVESWSGAAGEVIDSGGTMLHGRRLLSSAPTTTNVVAPSPRIASQHPTVIGGFCNAANFDGNAIVEVADSPLFDYTTQLSASAWIYPTAYPSELYSILSNDVNYEFHINSSGRLYWWWQASTLTSAATIPRNQWTHVAITFDSSSGIRRQRIYINGVLDNNTNNWQGTLAPNNCNFYIGGDVATGAACSILPGRNFRGMIDEVKLYSFELSAAEVVADMTLGRSCSGTFDHVRIEHNGNGSVCSPERVTLKACLNPECTALYPGTVTVSLAPSGWVGGNTFSFNGGIASRYLSRGSSGDVVLGTTGVSPLPAGSTRCFSGGSETCTMRFTAASCDFDAVEPGAVPQTPIYTKLSGTPFELDLVALLGPTTINPDYLGTVAVDLVDSTGTACPAGGGLTAATNISFVEGDVGRKTVSISYPDAARNVRVRISVAESAPACSSDNFAIRPTGFLIDSADANNAHHTGLPVFSAGAPFALSATAISGYEGVPVFDAGLLIGTPHAGALTGGFDAATGGTASGSFAYTEVGNFGLLANAVYDDTFTAVDQPDDCRSGFSNVLMSGRYGCSIGSAEVPLAVGSSGFGRFIPDHFQVSTNIPEFTTACGSFTYMGQPFHYATAPVMNLSAHNAGGGVTRNYAGNYWKLTNASLSGKSYVLAAGNPDTSLLPGTDPIINENGDGTGTLSFSSGGGMAVMRAALVAPFDAEISLQINVADSDGVTYPGNPAHFGQTAPGQGISFSGGKEFRYGRMILDNAYGPETLSLAIPLRTEYYNGSSFVPNADDICTPYASTFALLDDYTGSLAEGDTIISGTGTLLNGADGTFSLSAPGVGKGGSLVLKYNLTTGGADLPWLQFDWEGGGTQSNPTAKATFGIFKGNPRLIYMRESVW